MKRLKKLLMFVISLIILPNVVNAASGSITVSGTSQAVVGNKVSVTVKLSSSTGIGSWQMQLNYDKSYLQLTSSSAEAGGTVMASASTTGVKSKTYTFTFKTLKTGSTKISVSSYEAYAFADLSELSLTSSSKTIKIITQKELEASYSKDNNLKSLVVEGYELTPEFSKDNLNYVVNVPEGTTSVNVKATKNDNTATVQGDGTIEVAAGTNNIAIVVRAQNGSEKTYNLAVNVIDQNPINVKVDNKDFTVVKLRNNYTCPDLFTESEIEIDGFKVPTCVNDKINYTLVGLKENDGTITNYIYNNNTYNKYIETTGTSLKIIILDYDKEVNGLIKTKEKIDDIDYDVYKYNDNSKNFVVYGMNIETGDKDFYVYDSINKTFTSYDHKQLDDLEETNKIYLYVIVAFGVSLLLSFICIISLSSGKKKLKKIILNNSDVLSKRDNKKERKNKEKDKNEIEEKKEIKEENIIIEEDNDEDEFLKDISPKEKRKKDKQRRKEEKLKKKEQ